MEREAQSRLRRNAKHGLIVFFIAMYLCSVFFHNKQKQTFAATGRLQYHFFAGVNHLCGVKCVSLFPPPINMIRIRSDTTDTNKTKNVVLIQPPVPIKKTPPIYPRLAVLTQAEGGVLIRALVDTLGKVKDVAVDTSDGEIFNKAALHSARRWQFKPAQQNNKPVEAKVIIPFTFKLDLLPAQRDLARKRGIPPPDTIEIGEPPAIIKHVKPQYPKIARENGVQGTVWLKIWVDEAGEVRFVLVEKGSDSMLNPPSIEAARQMKFKPALGKNGHPVAVWIDIPFHFRLSIR